jgi:S-layer homology domain
MRLHRALIIIALCLPVSAALAKSFPDVTKTSPHMEAIEKLADLGVISGHPDGTFRPRDPVNRVALLKMLYIAGGLTPSTTAKGCFKDIEKNSWYESYVCDAVARGFVQGYENNTLFRGARSVTRAEAVKLSIAVLGLPSTGFPPQKQFTDIKRTDWFATYVDAAVGSGMLPLPGQEQYKIFYGNLALSRGEAASFIWRARAWKLNPVQIPSSASSSSSSVSSVSSASSLASSSNSSARTSVSSASVSSESLATKRAEQQANEKKQAEIARANTKQFKLPFTSTDAFAGKLPRTYRLQIPTAGTYEFTAAITSKVGTVSCRLFRLERDGVSVEYYLGYTEGQSCFLRTAVTLGTYQFDVIPSDANSTVKVQGAVATGDGNDGFSQAKLLTVGQVRTDVLDANDLADWYTFSVPKPATDRPAASLQVSLVSTDGITCLVYPMSDVDLFGFSAPKCNEAFAYPAGTYMINIRHVPPRAAKQAYTVSLK